MKAIINGLRYDTDKAALIGEASANCSRTDFQWWKAGLYKTPRSGKFFLSGGGGPMSMWATRINNGWHEGDGIKPMNPEEAREWAERHLSIAEVETGFAEQIQDA